MTPPTASSAAADGLDAARARAGRTDNTIEFQRCVDRPFGKRLLACHEQVQLSYPQGSRESSTGTPEARPTQSLALPAPPPLGSSTGQNVLPLTLRHAGATPVEPNRCLCRVHRSRCVTPPVSSRPSGRAPQRLPPVWRHSCHIRSRLRGERRKSIGAHGKYRKSQSCVPWPLSPE